MLSQLSITLSVMLNIMMWVILLNKNHNKAVSAYRPACGHYPWILGIPCLTNFLHQPLLTGPAIGPGKAAKSTTGYQLELANMRQLRTSPRIEESGPENLDSAHIGALQQNALIKFGRRRKNEIYYYSNSQTILSVHWPPIGELDLQNAKFRMWSSEFEVQVLHSGKCVLHEKTV